MSKVKRILLRRSGTLAMFFTLESTVAPGCEGAGGPRGVAEVGLASAVRELVALGGRSTGTVGQRHDLDSTARRRDGCLGGLGEAVSADAQGARQLAPTEHLDEGALVGEAVLVQQGRGDLVHAVGLGDGREDIEVDGLVLDAERVVEALQLRDPLLDRHLAAFEAARHRVAGVLALGAAARGLAALAADAAADPLRGLGRARRWLQFVDAHVRTPGRSRAARPLRPRSGGGPC